MFAENVGMTEDKLDEKETKMTKKQRKELAQMQIFDLKMQVDRPDMIESWDVTATDP